MLKQVRGEAGVSEVVGTILILAITVVLFTAVFAYVSQIPKTSSPVQIYFSSTLSYSNSTGIIYENVTDEGGNIVLRNNTDFIVMTAGNIYRFSSWDLYVTSQFPHPSSYLEPGDTIHWSSVLLDGKKLSGELRTMIQYTITGQILWEATYNISSTFTDFKENTGKSYSYLLPGSEFTLLGSSGEHGFSGNTFQLNLFFTHSFQYIHPYTLQPVHSNSSFSTGVPITYLYR